MFDFEVSGKLPRPTTAASKEVFKSVVRWGAVLLFVNAFAIFVHADTASPAHAPVAAVFLGEWRGTDAALARQLSEDVTAAGYAAKFIGPETLTNSEALRSLKLDLLVLPQARFLPLKSMEAVRDYLRGGGRMMAFGLPAWESTTFSFGDQILTKQDYQTRLNAQVADHALVDFAGDDFWQWKRSTDSPGTKTQTSIADVDGQKTLHVTVDTLVSWDILDSPILHDPFADGQTLTCFRARGAPDTRAMSIEFDEEDGSRWIATIDLTPEWKSYCLAPESFRAWEPHGGRGGAGDGLHVQRVKQMKIGLARSHSGLPGPHHEYWIGNIGTARSPFAGLTSPETADVPQIDTLSPDWKFYPMHGALKINTPDELALVSRATVQPEERTALPQAMQPRPRGLGFNQDRPWRWQPLLEARSPEGDYRGAMATLMVHFDGEFRHGIWACLTPESATFYQQESVRRLIRQTAQVMRRGLFLEEGGSEFFTVFEGQKFNLGARAVNFSGVEQTNLSLRITVKPKTGGAAVYEQESLLNLAAGATGKSEGSWLPRQWPRGGFVVTTELVQDGGVIDRLEHELNIWAPKPKPAFVQERDGGFWLRGKPWKVNGVNYMPSTGIGVSSGNYFENWLGQGAYDPDAIARDLNRIKAMNLNAVSIFIDYSSIPQQNLIDFLRRCDALKLHVNQSLRPGTPLDFQWDKIKALIEFYHLADNDTIFAYDLAWEAEHHDEQRMYGRDWTTWVNKHYGGPAQAAYAWGVPAPSLDAEGVLSVPPLHDLANDGPWRVMVADYRAFLDGVLADKYGEARRLVHSIDPHHAVSFRMNEAGDPTFNSDQRLPFDFYGLAKAVDIWAPEGYGRIGDWEHVRQGRFDVDYARLCDPKKPFMWAEFGYSVWDERRGAPSPEKLEFAANFYRDFYRMATESGCDGLIFWWYPGGYRVNEQSDYGIINPDGTDREITKVIRDEGPKFLKAAKLPPPDYFISINRDRDARGLYGIYQAVKKNYWQAIAEGKTPALRWETEPGKK